MSNDGSLRQSVPTPESYSTPPITIVITIILLVFFFVGFFALYFCRCFMQNLILSWHLRHSPAATPIVPTHPQDNPGIDPKIIQSFPAFTYSIVKDYRKEKYGLECAICLVEFGDDDLLRLLTTCCHVFHQECIDLWLEKHKTCPVCRRRLDESPEKSPISFTNTMRLINGSESLPESVSITVKDETEDERGGSDRGERRTSATAADHVLVERRNNNTELERFSRSHSTGHSIVRTKGSEDQDRFTLRLPEQVQEKIIKGHNTSRSCTVFGEYRSQETTGNGGFGEVSGLSGADFNKD
ncbi:RING-H2 finger protein ATL29-like [Coffea arabica]|uniref:RING-type E3 ubiquitin transferase n=1 Tax=Coffea arabica TaxID=13443 RepID=A0A6P6TYB7_COFAR